MSESEQYRREATTTRITQPTHDRIHEHNRESETLSATIARALDALEREQDLPAAVTAVMKADIPTAIYDPESADPDELPDPEAADGS